jgi:lipoic acid synthetase
VHQHRLATVCEEAKCPNIGECWYAGTATIMLMGAVCTRACRFCSVDTGNPRGWLDAQEPANVAASVALMQLSYNIVLTSVNRDDLPDGGAAHYAACIRAIPRGQSADCGSRHSRQTSAACMPMWPPWWIRVCRCLRRTSRPSSASRTRCAIRAPAMRRRWSVPAFAKAHRPEVLTKSSLMLGLGETDDEVLACMDDPRAAQVDILTLGQYLRPTPHHLPAARFVTPEQFELLRSEGLKRGFREPRCRADGGARAIAPSRHWPATTSACRPHRELALARAGRLRTHLARHAAPHRYAYARHRR